MASPRLAAATHPHARGALFSFQLAKNDVNAAQAGGGANSWRTQV
jgi:hypothetical protein